MKAAVFEEHGDPDVIRVVDIDPPDPGPGQVRIRVRASSLNHLDLWVRRGLPIRIPMPHIGGSDIAGEVESVGPGVDVEPGTRVVVDPTLDWEWVEGVRRGPGVPDPDFRVIGEHTQGGFSEFAVVPTDNLLAIPEGVSFQDAAASALVGVTAWRALRRGGLTAGERVLVTGASGGVSTMAIQFARAAGATVYALTSGPDNVRRVRELGADVVMDRLEGDPKDLFRETIGRRGVDVIVDSVGEVLWEALIRTLAPRGRLVTYGATTGHSAPTDLRHIFWKQLSVIGTTMGSPAEFRQAMGLVFEGRVRAPIDDRFPLDRLRDAHERLEAGGVFGKLAIEVG